MDIKKSDSPLFSGGTPSITKQTSASQNQTNPQLNSGNLKVDSNGQIRIGQQIELLVLKITTSEALLQIAGSKQQVHTADKALLQVGQQLKAQITATEPLLQLKILSQPAASQSIINATLRQIMPIQQTLTGLLESIQLLTKANVLTDSPAALTQAARRFSQSLPPMEAFKEANILPEILKKSGLFTEHMLAHQLKNAHQPLAFPNNDLKIALLRLAAQIRSLQTESRTPPQSDTTSTTAKQRTGLEPGNQSVTHGKQQTQQAATTKPTAANQNSQLIHNQQFVDKLLHQTEGVLARLQTLQLQHAQTHEQDRPAWSFELPVRTNNSLDHIKIHIEQDDETKNKNYIIPWKAILKFNIEELGAIQAHVTLQGSKVSVNFWTENTQISRLFSEHFNLLHAQFDKAGLETGQLNCRCDKAPQQTLRSHGPLIDETI